MIKRIWHNLANWYREELIKGTTDYSKTIEYWERIEHVKPTRTYNDEWRRNYYR